MTWQKKKIGNIINLKRGYDLPTTDRIEGDIPIISSAGITDFHNDFKKNGEGVVTGRYGTLGELFYINGKYWPLNTTLYVTDFKGNHPKFIYYFLKTIKIERFNGAAAVPGLDRNVLHKVDVLFPTDLPIQRTIASILSAYDDLIEINKQRIRLLEQMAEEIYKEWFVRMRFPGYETAKFVDGLPEGWKHRRLDGILHLLYGKSLLGENRDGGNFPVYGSSGIVGFHSKALVKGPGIILGRKGNVGSLFYSYDDFYPIDTVYYVESDHSLFYLYSLLKTIHFINGDAAVPGLNREQACSSIIVFPSGSIIDKFDSLVSPIYEQRRIVQLQTLLLQQTRDLLLPRLISGKLSVEHLVEQAEEGLSMAAEPRVNCLRSAETIGVPVSDNLKRKK